MSSSSTTRACVCVLCVCYKDRKKSKKPTSVWVLHVVCLCDYRRSCHLPRRSHDHAPEIVRRVWEARCHYQCYCLRFPRSSQVTVLLFCFDRSYLTGCSMGPKTFVSVLKPGHSRQLAPPCEGLKRVRWQRTVSFDDIPQHVSNNSTYTNKI